MIWQTLGSPHPERSYQEECQYLLDKQWGISARFFEAGVSTAIVHSRLPDREVSASGATGVKLWDRLFVPGLAAAKQDDRSDDELMLCVFGFTRWGQVRSTKLLGLGEVDSCGGVHAYARVREAHPGAADIVYDAARELMADRDKGRIPHLRRDLLDIDPF